MGSPSAWISLRCRMDASSRVCCNSRVSFMNEPAKNIPARLGHNSQGGCNATLIHGQYPNRPCARVYSSAKTFCTVARDFLNGALIDVQTYLTIFLVLHFLPERRILFFMFGKDNGMCLLRGCSRSRVYRARGCSAKATIGWTPAHFCHTAQDAPWLLCAEAL